jgi:hypothetical protein
MKSHGHVAGELFPVPHRTACRSDPDRSAHDPQLIHGLAHQALHDPVTAARTIRVREIRESFRSSKNLLHSKTSQEGKIRNSNIETRNKPEIRMTKKRIRQKVFIFGFGKFEFVSDFGIRISNLTGLYFINFLISSKTSSG